MPVRRRFDRRRVELSAEEIDWLHDGTGSPWIYFHQENLAELWRTHEEAILAEHVAASPGTRPRRWWEWSAPEPRRRLGGVGTPKSDVLAHVPRFWCGVPLDWVSRWEAAYYNGRALDVHGRPILNGYREGHFQGVPIDPDDPPMFESEAAYLDRHGLMLSGERRRLKPADFEPESALEILCFDEKE